LLQCVNCGVDLFGVLRVPFCCGVQSGRKRRRKRRKKTRRLKRYDNGFDERQNCQETSPASQYKTEYGYNIILLILFKF